MARRSDHSREELVDLAMRAARQLAEKDGLRGVTARGVAREIGYTIGTIYNLYDDLDDLIVHLNVRTLDELCEVLSAVKPDHDPVKDLLALARGYVAYTRQHPRLWGLLLEHRLPEGRVLPNWYYERIERLYGLIESAIEPILNPHQKKRSRHLARVLWSSIHGISSLEALGKLAAEESQAEMAETLIRTFATGLRLDKQGKLP